VTVAEGLGCKALRVRSPNEFKEAFARARELMREHRVPVVLEFIVERVTNVSMGTEIHSVNEFEEILCLDPSLTLDDVSGSMLRSGGDAAGPARQQEERAPA
jgi:tartronate-semialdehyde synthase